MPDSYEIDFHPVGDGKKSGDAITGQVTIDGVSKVFVIDGGTLKSGAEVADCISRYYGTNVVDYMILTHADDDHSSGLREIFDRCEVKELWMKRPWEHAADLVDKFKDGWTVAGLEKRLRECFPILSELEEKAIESGISIYSPFAGSVIGPFVVLSPSIEFYLELLPQMDRTPDQSKEEKVEGVLAKGAKRALEAAQLFKQTVFSKFETWTWETLEDGGETSPSNESSVVLYATVDERNILLTGDAGSQALTQSADRCDRYGLQLQNFRAVSMPHHGSRRNIGPTLLNRIVGYIVPEGSETTFVAVASASKEDDKHPRRVVLNAFKRRGAKTLTTENGAVLVRHNAPARPGFHPIESIPFYDFVEE